MGICICFLLVFLSAFTFFTKAAAASDFDEIKVMAEQGNFKAQYQLALMYEDGDGVEQDYAWAIYWHRQAAEQGYDWSQYNLGLIYSNGRWTHKDDRQAVAWYRKAAEQGHSGAQHNLGIMYADGRGVKQDDVQAIFWYRKAAEQDYSAAQCNLGLMYSKGRGVKQDDIQAAAWYHKAAEQGHQEAQHNLSVMYDDGRGVPRDSAQSIFWLRKAAERDISDLQYIFGELYDKCRDYLIQKLGYILYHDSFQHKLLPSIFWRDPGKIIKDMEHPERVLSSLLAVDVGEAYKQGLIEFEFKDEIIYFIAKNHWLNAICRDYVQSVLGEKIALEKHSYSDKDVFILKFLAINVWSPSMCERIYFISNKERSRFALYTVEMANGMGKFMICGHTKDRTHVDYGTAPTGEEAVSNKIFDLFSQMPRKKWL